MVIKPSLLGWLLSWAFSINKNSNKQLPLANFTFEQPLPIIMCKCTNSVRTALVTSANVVANIQGRWVWKQAWYFWPCLRVCAKYINLWSGWAGAGVGEIVRVFVCARLRCTCMRASGCVCEREREREREREKERKEKRKKNLRKLGKNSSRQATRPWSWSILSPCAIHSSPLFTNCLQINGIWTHGQCCQADNSTQRTDRCPAVSTLAPHCTHTSVYRDRVSKQVSIWCPVLVHHCCMRHRHRKPNNWDDVKRRVRLSPTSTCINEYPSHDIGTVDFVHTSDTCPSSWSHLQQQLLPSNTECSCLHGKGILRSVTECR